MKNKVSSKPSKASLVARGLAAKSKPPALKRVQKGKEKPAKETKPGYSLYTSDSEDQASSIDRGLNRCAALLSNILDNEDQGLPNSKVESKVSASAKPVKPIIWKGTTSQPPKLQKTEPQKAKAFTRHVVIPTARTDDKVTPSPAKPLKQQQKVTTAYNDRLVSSTPVLSGEERQRRQQLQRRESELQQELTQLKQRYELLQKQQSPGHQKQQQLQLQSSMMQELENHQDLERIPTGAVPQYTSETHTVLSSGDKLMSHPSSGKSSARRSLDYSGFPVKHFPGIETAVDHDVSETVTGDTSSREESHMQMDISSQNSERTDGRLPEHYSARDDSETQGMTSVEPKKRVRIVSPMRSLSPLMPVEQFVGGYPHKVHHMSSSAAPVAAFHGSGVRQGLPAPSTPPQLLPVRPSSAPARSRDGRSPATAENQARMVQYLIDELRALLGNTGDLEVDRLLNEIDDAVKLLPYMLQKDKTVSTAHDAELVLQPLRVENSQLRRKLHIANENLKEGSLKHRDEKSSGRTDLAFELAACRSVNTVLQKQLTEEKNSKEEILGSHDQLSQNFNELREEKGKFLQILSNKEQDHARCKREWQQETSRVTVENKKLKADLEAVQFSAEAEKKEINILSLSLKQKDAEIDRLKELTKGLQHSLTRLLSDIQQFQPNSVQKRGLLDTSVSFEGLDKLFRGEIKTRGETTSQRFSPDVRLANRSSGNPFSPHLSYGTVLNHESAPSVKRLSGHSEGETWKWRRKSPQKTLRFADAAQDSENPDDSNGPISAASAEGHLQEEEQDGGGDLSPLSSGEEEDFRRDLASLDANIARIQKSLRETARRT